MRGILKQVFEYAINRLLIDVNPVDRIAPASIASVAHRDRVLNRDDIGSFLRGLDAGACREQSKIALKIILLTLVRKQELLRARWEDIDFEAKVWRITHTKNRKPLDVFLSRQVVEMFARLKELAGTASPLVLPHISRLDTPMGSTTLNMAIARVLRDGNNGLAWFTVHDLRRTGATHLNELGFGSDIVEKSLNHVAGGVRGIYNRATYANQRRDMLQRWADIVESWIEPKPEVVAIRGSRLTA